MGTIQYDTVNNDNKFLKDTQITDLVNSTPKYDEVHTQMNKKYNNITLAVNSNIIEYQESNIGNGDIQSNDKLEKISSVSLPIQKSNSMQSINVTLPIYTRQIHQ